MINGQFPNWPENELFVWYQLSMLNFLFLQMAFAQVTFNALIQVRNSDGKYWWLDIFRNNLEDMVQALPVKFTWVAQYALHCQLNERYIALSYSIPNWWWEQLENDRFSQMWFIWVKQYVLLAQSRDSPASKTVGILHPAYCLKQRAVSSKAESDKSNQDAIKSAMMSTDVILLDSLLCNFLWK